MNKQHNGTFQPVWKFGNEFYCEKTGVAVVVNKSSHKIPHYSFKSGRYKLGDESTRGLLMPFIGARVTKDDIYSGVLDVSNIEALTEQLAYAVQWAKEDLEYECSQARQDVEKREAASRDNHATRKRGNGSITTETEVQPVFVEAEAA